MKKSPPDKIWQCTMNRSKPQFFYVSLPGHPLHGLALRIKWDNVFKVTCNLPNQFSHSVPTIDQTLR